MTRLSSGVLSRIVTGMTAALALIVVLAACTGGGASSTATPAVAETDTPTEVDDPTRVSSETATAVPDVGLVNTFDPNRVDQLRTEDLNAAGHYDEVRVAEDGTRHLIPLNAVEWGGVAKDGIPSLDSPTYATSERWPDMVYDPDGLVIGVEVNGKHRAYPLQILIWHEIVNETFDGKHLLVTY